MAILIQEQEKPNNNKSLIIAAAVIGGLAAIGWFIYYVFFSATPFAEVVGNNPAGAVQDVSVIKIDAGALNSLINTPEWQQLKSGLVSPIAGFTGATSSKINPFESK